MIKRKSPLYFVVFALSVLVVIGCVGSCRSSTKTGVDTGPVATGTVRTTSEAGVRFIFEVHDQLLESYVNSEELDRAKLFNSALEGVTIVLKEKSIAFIPPKIESKTSLREARRQFVEEFWRVLALAAKIKNLKENELTFAATSAMLEAVGDSHTYFIFPEDYQQKLKREQGKSYYCGIGATIHKLEDNFFYLERIYANTPAELAGLKRFDRVVSVNGVKVPNNLKEIVALVRGEKGTEVELTVERNGSLITARMKRDDIVLESTASQILKDSENFYSYISINSFDLVTWVDVAVYLREAKEAKARGIVVDLRGNPGGRIFSLNATLDMFLKSGTPTFIVRGKMTVESYRTNANPLTDLPLVVLIDENAGSAAEIFAAVMQETGRAAIVGKKSGGFVNVGEVLELRCDAAMMVTIKKLTTAKGRVLEKNGVDPDVVIELTKDDIKHCQDKQLDKALEVLKEKTTDSKK